MAGEVERRTTRRGRRRNPAVTVEPVDEAGELLRATRFGDVFLGDIGPDGITAHALLNQIRRALPSLRIEVTIKQD